jgi:hypothetical protein
MKLDLFEKLVRKIIREELEFYNSKLINEIKQTSKSQPSKGTSIIAGPGENIYTTSNVNLKEGLKSFRNELAAQYGNEDNETMAFGNAEIPDDLKKVFNRDYSELMKKLK